EGVYGAGEMLEEAEELLANRFVEQKQECPVRTLSAVIEVEGIERIDLLKIDVQRAEYDGVKGIREEDWGKIRQVVMEAHEEKGGESEGRVEEIVRYLEGKGYVVVAEQERDLKGTDRYNIFAVREGEEEEEEEGSIGEEEEEAGVTAEG